MMSKVEYIYFQTSGMRSEYCEVGMIIEGEENYVSYLYEPCKISKSEVLIIPEDKVIFNKKRRELRINKSYLQSGEYQTQKDKLLEKFI